MASLPKSRPVTVEVLCQEEGKVHRSAIVAEGVLKSGHFPTVQIEIAQIWPD
jgi:hypothetical protein